MTNMIVGFLLGVLLYMGTISAVVTHRHMFGERIDESVKSTACAVVSPTSQEVRFHKRG